MKILLLINWKIHYGQEPTDDYQPSDYCCDEKFWFFKYFEDDVSVKVVDISSIPFLEKLEKKYIRFHVVQVFKVLPKLKKYDMIVSHGMTSGIFLAFIHRLLNLKMPPHIVVDISSFHRASTSGVIYRICRYAAEKIDFLIYHTPIQEKYYDRYFPNFGEKKKFVCFGVNADYWRNKKYQERKDKDTYIVCVGYRMRDWNTLLKAYGKTTKKYKLLLVGNGQIHSNDENVEILPFLSINDLMEYVYNAYFCVMPLEYKEYSYGQMTLLQQMAIGKFVLAADVPSIFPYESKGLAKYQPGDSLDLREKLDYYFDRPVLVSEYGKENIKVIKENYSEENMAADFEEIINMFKQGEKSI